MPARSTRTSAARAARAELPHESLRANRVSISAPMGLTTATHHQPASTTTPICLQLLTVSPSDALDEDADDLT